MLNNIPPSAPPPLFDDKVWMIYNVTKIFGREEASKREREKAVQRMREQNERKVGRDREKFVKEEEIMHF